MIKPNTEIAVRTASSGDGFVGLNINADSAEVIFPMGYHLSFEKNDMAVDIKNLILILHRFSEKKDGVLKISSGALHNIEKEIPISPFLWILCDWQYSGYYREKEFCYHSSFNGKIHWGRTIKIKKPLISGNSPVYLDFIVKKSEIKENILTEIHKYCVLKAYEIIGFLFLPLHPEIPQIVADNKLFISVVKAKLSSVFQQKEYILFHNILSILESLDNINEDDIYTFGTNSFEIIWEKLIDDMYGIKEITGFYPETTWYLTSGKSFRNMPLRPDTIMEYLCRIMLIGTLIYLIVCWSTIPDQIPTHYNAAGEIDDWGGKGMIWFTVIISWALYLGISFVERYPDIWNTGVEITRKNSEKVYRLLKYLIRTSKLIMTAVFSTLIIFPAMEKPLPGWFTPVYLILLTGNAVFWLIRIFLARN